MGLIWHIIKSLKICEMVISIFHINVPWVYLLSDSFKKIDSLKYMHFVGGADLSHYGIIVESLKPLSLFNPSPDMPIIGSCNSAANKEMMSKIWTNGIHYLTELKTLCEKEKLLVMSNFSFSHVFKSRLLLMPRN